jgi:hypothetical protein
MRKTKNLGTQINLVSENCKLNFRQVEILGFKKENLLINGM